MDFEVVAAEIAQRLPVSKQVTFTEEGISFVTENVRQLVACTPIVLCCMYEHPFYSTVDYDYKRMLVFKTLHSLL